MKLRNLCDPIKTEWAKRMRTRPTRAESALWRQLRRERLGVKFRRQAIIRGWIADFWCPSLRLIIEADGSSHVAVKDAKMDKSLAKLGIKTLRFRNEEILCNTCEVVDIIFSEIVRLAKNPHNSQYFPQCSKPRKLLTVKPIETKTAQYQQIHKCGDDGGYLSFVSRSKYSSKEVVAAVALIATCKGLPWTITPSEVIQYLESKKLGENS